MIVSQHKSYSIPKNPIIRKLFFDANSIKSLNIHIIISMNMLVLCTMINEKDIENELLSVFGHGNASVKSDDGVHFHATVVSHAFQGKSKIEQHQMVYQVLGEKVGNEIHALGLTTKIPEISNDDQ